MEYNTNKETRWDVIHTLQLLFTCGRPRSLVRVFAKHALHEGVCQDGILPWNGSLERPAGARGQDGVVPRVEVVAHRNAFISEQLVERHVMSVKKVYLER